MCLETRRKLGLFITAGPSGVWPVQTSHHCRAELKSRIEFDVGMAVARHLKPFHTATPVWFDTACNNVVLNFLTDFACCDW